jgi:hypothetical protein
MHLKAPKKIGARSRGQQSLTLAEQNAAMGNVSVM